MDKTYVNQKEVVALAKGAALELDPMLVEDYTHSLNQVIETLQETVSMDVTDVILEASVPCMIGIEDLREDEVVSDFPREEFLVNVPESLGGLVKVPTVIEG